MDGDLELAELMKLNGRKMPAQRPGRSKQDYSTPRDFLEAVKKRFGVKAWAWDLAADGSNRVTFERNSYFGPDHPKYRDALVQDWTRLRGDLWLNPPFANIGPWAEKCAASSPLAAVIGRPGRHAVPADRRIFFLVPAAVGSNWWARGVHEKALIVFPSPRLSFDGKNPYPKDVALCIYGEKPGYIIWRWK